MSDVDAPAFNVGLAGLTAVQVMFAPWQVMVYVCVALLVFFTVKIALKPDLFATRGGEPVAASTDTLVADTESMEVTVKNAVSEAAPNATGVGGTWANWTEMTIPWAMSDVALGECDEVTVSRSDESVCRGC